MGPQDLSSARDQRDRHESASPRCYFASGRSSVKQVPDPAAFLSRSLLLPRYPFNCAWLCSELDMEKDPVVFCRLGLKHHHPQLINSSAGTVKLEEDEGRGEQEPCTLDLPTGAIM